MRNKYISCYVAAFCAGLLSTACNDFLDEVPDNRTVIDTPEAVSELLVSAYPDANCVFFTESMSDNVTDRGNTLDPYVQPDWNRANRQAFYWEDIDMTYQDSPNYFWMASYQAIAAANHALEAIAELEAKGVDCSAQKGEALLCRAYNHFMLVNVFAQHYNPAFAATDMGVAYVTEPEKEVFGHYERVSVKETYDKIRKDLEEGLPLISNKAYGDTPKYHFTREAAQAFACRFYLYVGEWQKAIDAADEALGDNPTLRNWNQLPRTKARLVKAAVLRAAQLLNLSIQLPSVRALFTVLNRQIPSLLGLQVIVPVGIKGKENLFTLLPRLLDFAADCLLELNRLFKTQCAVHKILLVIDHDQSLFHLCSSCALTQTGHGGNAMDSIVDFGKAGAFKFHRASCGAMNARHLLHMVALGCIGQVHAAVVRSLQGVQLRTFVFIQRLFDRCDGFFLQQLLGFVHRRKSRKRLLGADKFRPRHHALALHLTLQTGVTDNQSDRNLVNNAGIGGIDGAFVHQLTVDVDILYRCARVGMVHRAGNFSRSCVVAD